MGPRVGEREGGLSKTLKRAAEEDAPSEVPSPVPLVKPFLIACQIPAHDWNECILAILQKLASGLHLLTENILSFDLQSQQCMHCNIGLVLPSLMSNRQ